MFISPKAGKCRLFALVRIPGPGGCRLPGASAAERQGLGVGRGRTPGCPSAHGGGWKAQWLVTKRGPVSPTTSHDPPAFPKKHRQKLGETTCADSAFQRSFVTKGIIYLFSWFSLALKPFKKIGQPSCGEGSNCYPLFWAEKNPT